MINKQISLQFHQASHKPVYNKLIMCNLPTWWQVVHAQTLSVLPRDRERWTNMDEDKGGSCIDLMASSAALLCWKRSRPTDEWMLSCCMRPCTAEWSSSSSTSRFTTYCNYKMLNQQIHLNNQPNIFFLWTAENISCIVVINCLITPTTFLHSTIWTSDTF